MFSGNIFRGIFDTDVVKQSVKNNSPPPKKKQKKTLENNMTPTVNKCVKLKSKLKLKRSMFLKSVIYLAVSTTE